jgi:hypothetical protein
MRSTTEESTVNVDCWGELNTGRQKIICVVKRVLVIYYFPITNEHFKNHCQKTN